VVAAAVSDGHSDSTVHPSEEHGRGLDSLTLEKRLYLNVPFFLIRWIVYFALWGGLAVFYYRLSVAQDEHGNPLATLHLQAVSGIAAVLFGLSLTFAAFDLIMSLDAHWFSTIFGVYVFSGAIVGFLALLILILMGLQRCGLLTHSVRVDHYHDLGKLLFGFVFFWGYIAFSQYLLIWYGNIPEETSWLIRRGMAVQDPNAWSWIILLLLFGHFLLPFAGLLSRYVKRHRAGLAFWAGWILVLHWIDVYWLVMPELTTSYRPLLVELACLIGLGSLFAAALARRAVGPSLVPIKDPRLSESLSFHNV